MLLFAALITGLVVDPSGAVIPGSKVELRRSAGAKPITTVESNYEGRFTMSGIDPGEYHLRITSPGFLAFRLGPLLVTERETKRLPDSMLRLSRKLDIIYCGKKFAAPRYKKTPSPLSLLRGNATAAEGVLTLTGGSHEFTATVKPNGDFQFENVPAGRYTLRATFPGYANFEIKRLTIPAKTAVELDGWIDTADCPPGEPCPIQRKVLRDDEHTKDVICL